NGAVLAAEDRLPQAPSMTVELPDRLGGGFLFVIGTTVWRADRWLGRPRALFASSAGIARVVVGLDRVYLRAPTGAHQAIDPRSGAPLDAGAWPGSSYVGSYTAMDGWRAVAITDLRGAVATFDAGATWKPLGLPIEPRDIITVGDTVAVGGPDASHVTAWFEVRGDGQIAKLTAPPKPAAIERSPSLDPASKSFGRRPLLAAIEDGWPLSDGTAVVARDGSLARIRVADGAIVDLAADAFPLKPARCHPIPLGRAHDAGAFGFVCGEPRGRSAVYAYDVLHGKMVELRHFDRPRVVLAAGNGAIAVRGGCAEDAPSDDTDKAQQSYCLLPNDGTWREVHLRGDIGGERVVVLSDGRLAVISPPHGDLATARLTVLSGGKATTHAIAFPPLAADVLRTLKSGLWLDGFEERKPGTLSGWVDAGGSALGIEIQLDGRAKHGMFVRDAGSPIVSGRYGLGWSPSRRGYETTDGGMTWTPLELPEPIAPLRPTSPAFGSVASSTSTAAPPPPVINAPTRGCGPVGCVAAGWMRVGWGAPKSEPPSDPTVGPRPGYKPAVSLDLVCEATRAPPPPVPPISIPTMTPHTFEMGGGPSSPWGSMSSSRGGSPFVTLDWSPFYSVTAPPLKTDELGLSVETSELADRGPRNGPLARFYAWGAKGPEWERTSRWSVRWVSPFGSSLDVHQTPAAAAPRVVIESSRFATGGGIARPVSSWSVAVGDDGRHALLIARRSSPIEAVVLELEADRPPLEMKRADGEPFGEIESAVRVAGHWFLTTTQSTGEIPAAVVWVVEGGTARELARVPRAGIEGKGPPVRLARRSDGRAIGIVVEGQPGADRSTPLRWLLAIDADTGTPGELEALGASDFADRDAVTLCTGDEAGWVVDVPWSGSVRMQIGGAVPGASARTMRSGYARMRLTKDRACVEQLAGAIDSAAEGLARLGAGRPSTANPPHGEARSIAVSAFVARARYALRCGSR
ncbi:MAG: hypothetical protein JWM74_4668, partial [Myxococcaceae bacterium]|nr:hypothetical protein [Myxococcaceae bacterium]